MKLCLDLGTGDPLVLVCALMCDEELFAWQAQRLKRRRRVLVVRSEGESSMEAAASELAGMLGALGLRRVDLLGLSMGGYIAQELLARRPHALRSLILADTKAAADPPETAAARLATIALLEDGRLEEVLEGWVPRLLAEASRESIGPRVQAMARRLGAELFAAQQRLILSRRDTREALRGFPGPALCLCGAQDAITPPAEHREMAALLPSGRWRVLPGNVGHLSSLEAPEAFLEAVESFLEAR